MVVFGCTDRAASARLSACSAFSLSTLAFRCRKASVCRISAATSCRKPWRTAAGITSATAATGFAETSGERPALGASGGDEATACSAAARSAARFMAHRCCAAASIAVVLGLNSNGKADSLRGVPGEAQAAFAAEGPHDATAAGELKPTCPPATMRQRRRGYNCVTFREVKTAPNLTPLLGGYKTLNTCLGYSAGQGHDACGCAPARHLQPLPPAEVRRKPLAVPTSASADLRRSKIHTVSSERLVIPAGALWACEPPKRYRRSPSTCAHPRPTSP